MKSLHDYRGEYAAALKRYKRAARRWWRLGGTYESMLAKRDAWLAAMSRCHLAQLNKPKRKVSKRAQRRAHAMLASMSRMVDATRSMGPMVMRIIARDVSDLPFDRAELPAETMGIRWPMTPGIPIVCQPELRPGDVFAEYSDGSIRQIAGRRGV